jgi:hypothetical protein
VGEERQVGVREALGKDDQTGAPRGRPRRVALPQLLDPVEQLLGVGAAVEPGPHGPAALERRQPPDRSAGGRLAQERGQLGADA